MITRSDFKTVTQRNAEKLGDRALSATLHLLHEAVPIERLTQSPDWNRYLELLAGLTKVEHERIEGFQRRLADPATVNIDQIMHLKGQLAHALGRLSALTEASELPQQLVGAAQRAREEP